ncbi:MAG: hypothetical protein AAGI14_03470 [Pseudomonadota bacterium]
MSRHLPSWNSFDTKPFRHRMPQAVWLDIFVQSGSLASFAPSCADRLHVISFVGNHSALQPGMMSHTVEFRDYLW